MSVRKLAVPRVALGMVVAGCGTNDSAETSGGLTKVRGATFGASLTSILEVVAAEQGIMKKHGIDFELRPCNSAADMYPALLSGDLDYVPMVFSSGWQLEEQGTCFKYMMAETGSQYSISTSEKSKLEPGTSAKVAASLKGKRIGVTARGAPIEKHIGAYLAKNGLAEGDVTFVAVGGLATGLTALENDQVDAVVSWAGWSQASENPLKELLKLYGPKGPWPDLIQTGSAVTCDYAKENPETSNAVCKGMHDAFKFAKDPPNSRRMGKIVAKTLKVSDSAGAQVWNDYKGMLTSPDLTSNVWNAQKKYVTTTKFTPKYSEAVVKGCDFS